MVLDNSQTKDMIMDVFIVIYEVTRAINIIICDVFLLYNGNWEAQRSIQQFCHHSKELGQIDDVSMVYVLGSYQRNNRSTLRSYEMILQGTWKKSKNFYQYECMVDYATSWSLDPPKVIRSRIKVLCLSSTYKIEQLEGLKF